MIRKQVLIREDQNAKLKTIATTEGVSEGELVRQGIDKVIAERAADPDDWKAAWLGAAGVWRDRDDIDEIMAEGRRLSRERFERLMRQWHGDETEDDAA